MSKRTRGLDYNSDDEDFDHLQELTPDQFLTQQTHSTSSLSNSRANRNQQYHSDPTTSGTPSFSHKPTQPGSFLCHKERTFQNTSDDVASHYDQIAKAALTLNRKESKILPLRNLNNWIKSVGINIGIHAAQEHIMKLAQELNINPNVIGLPRQVPHQQRTMHSLFEMQQRDDGIWNMEINPNYPLAVDTEIKLEPIYDPSTNSYLSINLSPPQNTTYNTIHQDPSHTYSNRPFHQRQNVYALDLCGGKGGDLLKWMENDLAGYVLSDISEESVKEALKRYNESINGRRGKKTFFAQFITSNLCEHLLHEFLHPRISFDVVAISFAFHYSFRTESDLRRMLQNISDRLRPGGYFVSTVPDSRVLMTRLIQRNSLSFGNSIYQFEFKPTPALLNWLHLMNPLTYGNYLSTLPLEDVTSSPELLFWCKYNIPIFFQQIYTQLNENELKNWIDYEMIHLFPNKNDTNYTHSSSTYALDPNPQKHNYEYYDEIYDRPKQPSPHPFHTFSPWGIQYSFTLTEAVDGVPEYLVLFPILCQIAAEYGLKPVLHENLQTFLHTQHKVEFGKNSNYKLFNTIRAFDIAPPRAGKDQDDTFQHNHRESLPFDPIQWEGVGVYCTIMFQKIGEIQYQGNTVYYDDISLTATPPTSTGSDVDINTEQNGKIYRNSPITSSLDTQSELVASSHAHASFHLHELPLSQIDISKLDRIFGRYSSSSHKQRHDELFTLGLGEKIYHNIPLPETPRSNNGNDASTTSPTQFSTIKAEIHSSTTFSTDIVPLFLSLEYEQLPTTIYPDPQTAGCLATNHCGYRYWTDYQTPLKPLAPETMLVCGKVVQQLLNQENEQTAGSGAPMKCVADYYTPTL